MTAGASCPKRLAETTSCRSRTLSLRPRSAASYAEGAIKVSAKEGSERRNAPSITRTAKEGPTVKIRTSSPEGRPSRFCRRGQKRASRETLASKVLSASATACAEDGAGCRAVSQGPGEAAMAAVRTGLGSSTRV